MNKTKLKLDWLTTPAAPWVLRSAVPAAELWDALASWVLLKDDFRLFVLDGAKMRSRSDFYAHMSASMNLPAYMGSNYNALLECLTDSDAVAGSGFVLLVIGAEHVLSGATSDAQAGFVDTLASAGSEWSQPVNVGEAWDRPSRPFHSILQLSGLRSDTPPFNSLPSLEDQESNN